MPPAKQQLGPCKKQACEIQACLVAQNYQEQQCLAHIQALIDCCDEVAALAAATGEGAGKPVHCAFSPRYRKLVAEAAAQAAAAGAAGGRG
jgi:hypothetical protein